MARVAIVFTGGTISSRFDPTTGGHMAALDGSEILAGTPGLERVASVEAIDWGRVPASQFTFAQLLEIVGVIRDALARADIDGAVVVQGTDSIEETSFALDLLLDSPKPVVITGSMRSPDQDGYEGAANLRDAVMCASASSLRDQGVVVAMAGEIHPADDVVKAHSEAYAAFKSPNLGPIGIVRPDGVFVARSRRHRRHVAAKTAAEPVHLFTSVIGSDGNLIRLAHEAGARGFVIAGAGTGNTPVDMLTECISAINDNIPVVLATRCSSGRTNPAYSFPGAGAEWRRAGAILAGTLSAIKARIALSLAIGAELDSGELRALFDFYADR
jgi:L-asparaginase